MSRLDELIAELCPDGVEYKKLGDIATKIVDGMHSLPKELMEQGPYPVISAQNIHDNLIDMTSNKYADQILYEKENKRTNVQSGDVLLTIVGAIGRTAIVTDQRMLFQRSVCVITPDSRYIEPWFLKYVLDSKTVQEWMNNNAHGAAQKGLYLKQVETIRVPVPPLPVQQEIVRILDHFTELTAELTAELVARKKQYEYYLNRLLDINKLEPIQVVQFGELFEVKNGLNKEKSAFGKGTPIVNFTDVYNKRYLTAEMLKGKVTLTPEEIERYRVRKGDVFFTRTSETKEDIGMSSTIIEEIPDCTFSGFVLRARPLSDLLLPKFCSYYFSTKNVRDNIVRYASFTTRATTSGPKLSKIPVPIIPIREQERIVSILDRFDTLCNDISLGLPAEIAARQKQYEYYRDKLLTFKEKVIE